MMPFLEGGSPFDYVMHHNMDEFWGPVGITKFTLNMFLSAAVLLVMVFLTDRRNPVPVGFLRNAFEGVYLFVRDEIAIPALGKTDTPKFMPLLMTLFTFILVMNLVGMIPMPYIGGAATSQLGMTIPLALTVFLVSVCAGIKANGVGGFMKHFVPSGVPGFVLPLIVFIEVVGFVVKHGVLAIRLMANMLGGHLVIGSFAALIALFDHYAVALFAVPMMVFINLLELLVSFIQAFVFTLLAALFIGGTVHPEH